MTADPIVIRNPKAYWKAQAHKDQERERLRNQKLKRVRGEATNVVELIKEKKDHTIYSRGTTVQPLVGMLLKMLYGQNNRALRHLPQLSDAVNYALATDALEFERYTIDGEWYVALSLSAARSMFAHAMSG